MQDLHYILENCPHQVPPCHLAKARKIDAALKLRTPFTSLGGVQINCNSLLVRFKLGGSWRLLYQKSACGLVPVELVSRQNLEHAIRRRRDI
jgi:hypothetical protein